MKFEIKNRFTGNVQFECELGAEHESKDSYFKLGLAIKIAVRQGADLQGADLQGAYLQGVDFREADFRGVDFREADFRGAYLRGVDFREADLQEAYFRGAYLQEVDFREAYLQGAYLRGADFRGADFRSAKYTDEITIERTPLFIQGLNWDITILDEHMKIGCELHLIKDWAEYDNHRILEMEGKTALKFWTANKEGLLAIAHGDKRGLK